MRRTNSLGKTLMLGDWRKEKGTTEDEVTGWHHRLDGHEFEQAPGFGDGQGGLACCMQSMGSQRVGHDWLNEQQSSVQSRMDAGPQTTTYPWEGCSLIACQPELVTIVSAFCDHSQEAFGSASGQTLTPKDVGILARASREGIKLISLVCHWVLLTSLASRLEFDILKSQSIIT